MTLDSTCVPAMQWRWKWFYSRPTICLQQWHVNGLHDTFCVYKHSQSFRYKSVNYLCGGGKREGESLLSVCAVAQYGEVQLTHMTHYHNLCARQVNLRESEN